MSRDADEAIVLSPPTTSDNAGGRIDQPRRSFIVQAGLLSAALWGTSAGAVGTRSAARIARSVIDRSCRVSGQRLDDLVAKAYPLFNKPAILPTFDASRDGARFDVDLHRIVTHTVVPETGERLRVSGLLAVPVGVKGELPLVSWQHGTILSFDQVPSNLTLLADPAYELTDAADSLETLFNVHRFAARGYAVVAADYVGKGPFREGRGEGYAVKGVSTRTCLDILAAGQQAMRSLGLRPSKRFLHGWSQGALNTQWLHQALRSQSLPVTGTAVASPFNDLNEAWSFWAGAQTFPLPAGVASYPALPGWISLCMPWAATNFSTALAGCCTPRCSRNTATWQSNTGRTTSWTPPPHRESRRAPSCWCRASSIALPTSATAPSCGTSRRIEPPTGTTMHRSAFTTGWPTKRSIRRWSGAPSPQAELLPAELPSRVAAIAAPSSLAFTEVPPPSTAPRTSRNGSPPWVRQADSARRCRIERPREP